MKTALLALTVAAWLAGDAQAQAWRREGAIERVDVQQQVLYLYKDDPFKGETHIVILIQKKTDLAVPLKDMKPGWLATVTGNGNAVERVTVQTQETVTGIVQSVDVAKNTLTLTVDSHVLALKAAKAKVTGEAKNLATIPVGHKATATIDRATRLVVTIRVEKR